MSNVLEQLYNFANARGLCIDNYRLMNKKAFCYQWNSAYFIAIDYSKLNNEREEKQIVAEEISHCEYDLLYKLSDCTNPLQLQNIHQAEARARRFKAKKIVPLDELKEALIKDEDIHSIAERLDVDDDILKTAIKVYQNEELL